MSDDWQSNDPQVSDDASLLRRIPNKPDYVVHHDSINGAPTATGRALQIDKGSGLSIHFEELLRSEHQVTPDLYYPDDYLIQFTPSAVRHIDEPAWGVVKEPDAADSEYGKAHCEVRHPSPRPSRSQREAVREAINRGCKWIRKPETPS